MRVRQTDGEQQWVERKHSRGEREKGRGRQRGRARRASSGETGGREGKCCRRGRGDRDGARRDGVRGGRRRPQPGILEGAQSSRFGRRIGACPGGGAGLRGGRAPSPGGGGVGEPWRRGPGARAAARRPRGWSWRRGLRHGGAGRRALSASGGARTMNSWDAGLAGLLVGTMGVRCCPTRWCCLPAAQRRHPPPGAGALHPEPHVRQPAAPWSTCRSRWPASWRSGRRLGTACAAHAFLDTPFWPPTPCSAWPRSASTAGGRGLPAELPRPRCAPPRRAHGGLHVAARAHPRPSRRLCPGSASTSPTLGPARPQPAAGRAPALRPSSHGRLPPRAELPASFVVLCCTYCKVLKVARSTASASSRDHHADARAAGGHPPQVRTLGGARWRSGVELIGKGGP